MPRMTMRLLGMMTVDNDVYCNKYEQVTRSMFIHKQLGAEDRRYTTVSTDSRTTTNSSSLLTGSPRRATLPQQALLPMLLLLNLGAFSVHYMPFGLHCSALASSLENIKCLDADHDRPSTL